MLEVDIETIPDFIAIPDDPTADMPPWFVEMQAFCKTHGYAFIETQLSQRTLFPTADAVWVIFIGPHKSGARHAIVGIQHGQKLFPVFDPLNPLGKPEDAFVDKHVEAICYLVPIDPAAMKLVSEMPTLVIERALLTDAAAKTINGRGKNHPTGH